MTKHKFQYDFIVFLYAYLRQIDLSLDRSRWTTWKELQEYYRGQISPKKIADYLLNNSSLVNFDSQSLYFIGNVSFLEKLKLALFRVFHIDPFLTNEEVLYCCQKLNIMARYLNLSNDPDRLEIEKLRIELVELNYNIIQFKLSVKDRNKAMRIEHYLQNENLNTIKIEEFIKGIEL
jgi:hypothetical protein